MFLVQDFLKLIFLRVFLSYFCKEISLMKKKKEIKPGKNKSPPKLCCSQRKAGLAQTERCFSMILIDLYSGSIDIDCSGKQHKAIKYVYFSSNHWLLFLKLLMIFKLFSTAFEPCISWNSSANTTVVFHSMGRMGTWNYSLLLCGRVFQWVSWQEHSCSPDGQPCVNNQQQIPEQWLAGLR